MFHSIIKHAILQLEFWIYPGTFYGICAPHKLPSNHIKNNRTNKGVSIISNQLPYTLQLVQPYPITSNSKAA